MSENIFLLSLLILFSSCSTAQEKEIIIKVIDDNDSTIVKGAEIKVATTTGDESFYKSDENGILTLNLKCDVGYFITCDFPSHHKEKLKLMKPCEDLKSDTINFYMKSNIITH